MDKSFTKIPNDILESFYSSALTTTQYRVMLYIIRKTYGFNKQDGDYIAIAKMANDLGYLRNNLSRTISELENMGMIEVYREWSRRGNRIKINPVSMWKKRVSKSIHVSESIHVSKLIQNQYQSRYGNRINSDTHKIHITKDTLQKKNPYNPLTEIEDEEGEPFPDNYWEEP